MKNQHNVQVIHVGKCGGSSVRSSLEASSVLSNSIIKYIHISKPRVDGSSLYYIIARDPIQRCISAFNWRYHLVIEKKEQVDKFHREKEVLAKYKYINILAEALYKDDGSPRLQAQREFNKVHHLKQRISYYLEDLLYAIDASRIMGVVMTESIADDMKLLFNTQITSINRKANKRLDDIPLTHLARKNLVRYIASDYCCLLKLYNLGKIRSGVMSNILNNAFANS